jgi:hypothetical protein
MGRSITAGALLVAVVVPGLRAADTALGPVAAVSPTSAATTTLYAYAGGGATSPASCPRTSTTSGQCTLAEALSRASAGSTVALATPGGSGHYVGNWAIRTSGSSSSAPLTIEPAPGITNPTLDGNHGNSTGCQTKACDGPVLAVGSGVHLDLDGVTVRDAADTSAWGGAIANNDGGSVVVSACTFTSNSADNGGAIANFKFNGTGTVAVSGSTFSGNIAIADGGAIDNADLGGKGTLSVSTSTFLANTAAGGDGGAIDNADYSGNGTVVVSGSTFLANTAGGIIGPGDGGAIANAGSNVTGFATSDGTVVVSGSTFWANAATNDGGAISNGGQGKGTLSVSTSTFLANTATALLGGHGGGAIANGYYQGGKGTLSVSASTFSGGSATNGGIIDNGDNASTGTVWAAADIFNGACYNVAGTWDDEGQNIGANGTCLSAGTGDVSRGAGALAPLAGNGGPTMTMVPLEGNPAVGSLRYKTTAKLNGRTVVLCPAMDQRGVRTASGQHCNAGAVQ